jgi:hypothetical protein
VRPAPRSRAQRRADTLAWLRTEVDCWVASADEMGNAHLVPLSHYWDDATADAHMEHSGFDPRTEPGDYVYLRVTPTEIRAWREANELSRRLLMRDGLWLPLDA